MCYVPCAMSHTHHRWVKAPAAATPKQEVLVALELPMTAVSRGRAHSKGRSKQQQQQKKKKVEEVAAAAAAAAVAAVTARVPTHTVSFTVRYHLPAGRADRRSAK